jgi:hypothetical protein
MIGRYKPSHPAKLAGVLRTAIGPASLAGQLAVRSTRAPYLATRGVVHTHLGEGEVLEFLG